MDFLKTILEHTNAEIAERKRKVPLTEIRNRISYSRTCISLLNRLETSDRPGIIAEFKRRSPSRGWISRKASVTQIVPAYARAGATAVSILTEEKFFGGSLHDLEEARNLVDLPLLRKDFIVDAYQLEEARASGADVVLLIAECLEKQQMQDLHDRAQELGMEVLVELHGLDQIGKLPRGIRLLGVNNRNLSSFEVNMNTSREISTRLPAGILLVSESGLSDPETIRELWGMGFMGFLMGEHFMREKDPGKAVNHFIQSLQT